MFTAHPTQRLEKQLQKQIAICLQEEGWYNDVPTSSGLVNPHGRQANIDLAHRIPGGFELIELKFDSNTPLDAAFQVLRYGAIYMLYRLEPELATRFKANELLSCDSPKCHLSAKGTRVLNSQADSAGHVGDHG